MYFITNSKCYNQHTRIYAIAENVVNHTADNIHDCSIHRGHVLNEVFRHQRPLTLSPAPERRGFGEIRICEMLSSTPPTSTVV